MATATAQAGVGPLLRDWRQRRRRSQLDVALDAGVSARHLSFVETGRAVPSPRMIVRLAAELEVPHRDRNRLLLAAGYAPLYPERSLDDEEMAPVREAIDLVLGGHEPYPAVVVDGHWNLLAANAAPRCCSRASRRSCSSRRRTWFGSAFTPRGWRRGSSTSASGARICSSACTARSR